MGITKYKQIVSSRLKLGYPIKFQSDDVKSELIVEMTYIQKSYPSEESEASSYIGDFLKEAGSSTILAEYGLEPFCVQVQALQRTLIDKVFALCDYYLSGDTERNSRHIYDIAKLLTKVNAFDGTLQVLVSNVRNDRKRNRTCLSAQDGVDVPEVLKSIINTEFFKKDYDETTLKLLSKPISYEDAIKSLQTVIDSEIFSI